MVFVKSMFSVIFFLIVVVNQAESYQCQEDKSSKEYGFACGGVHLKNCLNRATTTHAMKTVQYRAWFLDNLGNATDTYVETLRRAKEVFDAKKAIIHEEEARRRCLAEYEQTWLRDACRCAKVRVSSDRSSTVAGRCLPAPEGTNGFVRPAYYKWSNDTETYKKCGKVVRQKVHCDGCKFACLANGYTSGPDCENPPF